MNKPDKNVMMRSIAAFLEAGPEAVEMAVSLPAHIQTREQFLSWCRDEHDINAVDMQPADVYSLWSHKSRPEWVRVTETADLNDRMDARSVQIQSTETGQRFIVTLTHLRANYTCVGYDYPKMPF